MTAANTRDPLSVRYDAVTQRALIRAAQASRRRAGIRVWIASPRGDFRSRDKGGRTEHERAFTRSAYYIVKGGPNHSGNVSYNRVPDWSLKLTWGGDELLRASSAGRLARPVTVRLFPRSQARRTAPRSWRDEDGAKSAWVDGRRVVGG